MKNPTYSLTPSRWLTTSARVVIAALALSAIAIVGLTPPASATAPTVTMSISGPSELIAGENATYNFSATNTASVGGTPGFNLGFYLDVPVGIEFVSSNFGLPVIYEANDISSGVPAAGLVRWVWEDVSDLPATGTTSGSVTVSPTQPTIGSGETSATDVFPVGSSYTLTGYAFLGGDASLLPVFGGSTGVGGATAISETGSAGPSTATTNVIPWQMTKSEASPEAELLRGVHDQTTIYTLTVVNTNQGPTNEESTALSSAGVRLVDHLPAGLEFLGCGAVDNSTIDWDGADGAINEYEGAGLLTATPAVGSDCTDHTIVSVETIVADASDVAAYGLSLGRIYTEVVWDIGDLALGETEVVRYAAAVPLFENTMVWDDPATDPTVETAPTPVSLDQMANLDNNNGPSTRHGSVGSFDDGDTWTNTANVFGAYAGVVRTSTVRDVTDRTSTTIYAMDLSILKGIPVSGDREFDVDQVSGFSLTLRASEYMTSSDIYVTDTLSNGLCPVLPLATQPWTNASGVDVTDCTAVTGPVVGAEVDSVEAFADGTFQIVFRPTSGAFPLPADFELAPNDTHGISYGALNRGDYELAPSEYGPTTSGDGFNNYATFEAVSDGITPLTTLPDRTAPLTPVAGGTTTLWETWRMWDDSSASISSDFTVIEKRVMPRDDVEKDVLPGNPCTAPTTWNTDFESGFRMGDTACFELRVTFPLSIDVRNPVVTDFLPAGLAYGGFEVQTEANSVPAGQVTLDTSPSADGSVQWKLGAVAAGDTSGDLYVSRGQVFVVHVWATVVAPSNGPELDKPENLMKYRQQNVDGVLYFLRDEAAVEIDPELSLVKGVLEVESNASAVSSTRTASSQDNANGTVFASNRDGILVREGETVTYRIDLFGQPYPAGDAEVWDLLPDGITAADVTFISDSGTAYDPADGGYPAGLGAETRSVIIWTGIDVPYDGTVGVEESRATVTYDVLIPTGTETDTSHVNNASIISYSADINSDTTVGAQMYYPYNSFNADLDPTLDPVPNPQWNTNGAGTRDDSDVYLPSSSIAKSVTTPIDTNNSNSQVVTGEVAAFDITVTIPAYTSVANATLRDQVRNTANSSWIALGSSSDWAVIPSATTVTHPGGTTAGGATSFTLGSDNFTIDTTNGVLTFPALYDNNTASSQDFRIHVEAYVKSTSTWAHGNSSQLRDRGLFVADSESLNTIRTTTLLEHDPRIAKLADDDTLIAGQTVGYTLTATNTSGRPTSYDTVVTDCLPAALTIADDAGHTLDINAPSQGTVVLTTDPTCESGAGNYIVWTVGTVTSSTTATLTYDAHVAPEAAGGASYTNTARITGYSLPSSATPPDRDVKTRVTTEVVTVIGSGISKTVDQPKATIGEERDFVVSVSIPADVNFYDVAIIDDIPAGMTIGSATAQCTITTAGDCDGTLGAAGTLLPTSGTLTGWWFGDVLTNPSVRTITVTYTGTVIDVAVPTNDRNDTLVNTARMRWNVANVLSSPPANASYTGTNGTTNATATVTVTEPVLTIAKTVDGGDTAIIDLDETADYVVTVTNTDGASNTNVSTAYGIEVVDTIPDGLIVNEASISGGGVLAGQTATGGGTISWTITSLAPGASVALTYNGVLTTSDNLDGGDLTNTVDITEYFSHDDSAGFVPAEVRQYDGPTADAVITPAFPDPAISKIATTNPVYIGGSYEFTVTVTNNGDGGGENLVLTDALPPGFLYTAGTTTIATVAAADPVVTTPGGVTTLTWSTLPDLAAGASVVLTYEATVDSGHTWTTANTGAGYDHTNSVTIVMDDTSGEPGNFDGVYTASTTEDVQIHRADLSTDKSHTGNATAGETFAWDIVISNSAVSDTAIGPIVVTDTLPADANYVSIAGTDWVFTSLVGDVLTVTHPGPLAADASLPTLTVNVTIDEDVASGTDFTNTAVVGAVTWDPDLTNNDDDDPVSVVHSADLQLLKDNVGTTFIAGTTISWTLDVTNNGPSIGVNDFVITDSLPAEVQWTTVVGTGTGWTCDPVTVGGDLVCTAASPTLAVGASLPTLTVSGTVWPYSTGTIVNDARVDHPTPDPLPDNNDDDATIAPVGTSADLSLEKTTVTKDIPANGTGRYRIEVAHAGPSDALNVIVTDTLPGGLTYDGNITSQAGDTWDCVVDGGDPSIFVCTLTSNAGTMEPGDTSWFEFDVQADATVTAAVLNTATVSSDTPDADLTNNTDDSLTEPQLTVNKSVDNPTPERGSLIVYTINVESLSYGYTDDVVLTDPFPAEIRVTDITIETSTDPSIPDWLGCTLTGEDLDGYGGTMECVLDGTLERGRTTPNILVTAQVNPLTVPGPILNVGEVAWTDPNDVLSVVLFATDDATIGVTLTSDELAATGVELERTLGFAALFMTLGALALMFARRRFRMN